MTITLDDSTQASNPGRIKVSLWRYLRYFSRENFGFGVRYVYVIALSWLVSQWLLLIIPLIVWKHMLELIRVKEHFLHGCVNPGIVINSQENLVAVFTNLTAIGTKPTPVIKVITEKLSIARGRRLENGDRVATVAVYCRAPDNPWATSWEDFIPRVVNCFTGNNLAIEQALDSISPLAWTALKDGLKQLGSNPRPGLYPVDIPDDLAFNAF